MAVFIKSRYVQESRLTDSAGGYRHPTSRQDVGYAAGVRVCVCVVFFPGSFMVNTFHKLISCL